MVELAFHHPTVPQFHFNQDVYHGVLILRLLASYCNTSFCAYFRPAETTRRETLIITQLPFS